MEEQNPLKIIGILFVMLVLLIVSIILLVNRTTSFTIEEAILDQTYCVDNKYIIYEDDTLVYYLTCEKTYTIIVDEESYTINDALKNEKVTIDELKDKDITIYNYSK